MRVVATGTEMPQKRLNISRAPAKFFAGMTCVLYECTRALAAMGVAAVFLLIVCATTARADAKPEPAASAQTQGASGAAAEAAAPEPYQEDEAIKAIWTGQRKMLDEVAATAAKLGNNFTAQTATLSAQLEPYEEEARRLLVLANTFKGYPNAMEAVNRRIAATIAEIDDVMEPLNLSRQEAEGLLERINFMAENLPEAISEANQSAETRDFLRDVARARLRLAAVIAQYDTLTPSLDLVRRLEAMHEKIGNELPGLWRVHYLQRPVAYLSPEAWDDFLRKFSYTWKGMQLRLPVELPITPPQWGTAVLRFFICLAFSGVIASLLYRQYGRARDCRSCVHIFRVSVPLLCLGAALLGASLSASGDFFRLFLALGNLALIFGQVLLAWDLRLLKFPGTPEQPAPFLTLMPLTVCAYLLLYLPLIPALVLLIWTALLIADMFWIKSRARRNLGQMQLEGGVLDANVVVLWICLLLAISGLHIYSMGLYLLFVSCSLALELSLGGMMLISRFNENLPEEGSRAMFARVLVALAAPLVLVAAVTSVLLWVGTVPGGLYLVQGYAFRGVTIGETKFGIIQLLLIVSGFYITRMIVSMGSRFLSRLPAKGLSIDLTLIPPLQTAFTYAVWAVYGLFVLRSVGLDLNSLALVAGGLSVGIGFGMQAIVNNFLSGLILIFSRTLQAGDVVEVGTVTGRVRKISVRATMVETYDNATIYVPNSELMAGRLTNWTRTNRTVRREVRVGVAYGSNTEEVTALLLEVAAKNDDVLKFPSPSVVFADFGPSSLDFILRFWVRDYDVGVLASSRLRLAIEKVFRERGIEVAFPQLDVHVKDLPASAMTPSKTGNRPRRSAPGRPRPGSRRP